MATISGAADVVTFLRNQHEQIKTLFARVIETSGEQRQQHFDDLRRLLAVHETAEEQIVHPKAKGTIVGGDEVVGARLEEENQAKQALAELEKMDIDSAEFEKALAALQKDVIAHAEAEEREEFSKLSAELDEQQLERMRNAAELAERTAPTHPHPGVESRGANMLAGPFAAMLDRAKDTISGHK